MDSNLEKTLRKRQEANQCIICGKNLNNINETIEPTLVVTHAIFGEVLICEEHIKSSKENKANQD